jgi:hypothetical protein
MGPMIADLIVLLQKNKQACFGKDIYREPHFEELLPWERALQQQQQNDSAEQDIKKTTVSSPSRMAISNTP